MKIIITENSFQKIFKEILDYSKIKMSVRKQGILNPNYGKNRDEKTKSKISIKMKKYWDRILNRPT